jgi:anti-sigma28 factor (negative regulator of flagellin synthesis)
MGVLVSGANQMTVSQGSFARLRADKVASIKQAIESGNYKDNSRTTAAKIVQSLTDYSLAQHRGHS